MAMQPDQVKRIKKLTISGAALGCAGILYGYVLVPLGVGIPCFFREVTGLRCPGCGVSRMCLALMHLHLREAVSYNIGLALCLPFLALLGIRLTLRYIRTGSNRLQKWENCLTIALIAVLLAWAVLRNIIGL